METVLVVGSTGNIGASAVKAALRSNLKVLAIVRNQASADKLIKYLGSSDGITFVEADVVSDSGVKGVVDKVRAGDLPSFQHVYSAVGGQYSLTPLPEITTSLLRRSMNSLFESNFFAYRDTIGYLYEQNHPSSTWTICTGGQGEIATHVMPAMTQGALLPLARAARRDNLETNVRFNEVFLWFKVEIDEQAARTGATPATDFAAVYEQILANPEIRSARVRLETVDDIKDLKWEKDV